MTVVCHGISKVWAPPPLNHVAILIPPIPHFSPHLALLDTKVINDCHSIFVGLMLAIFNSGGKCYHKSACEDISISY